MKMEEFAARENAAAQKHWGGQQHPDMEPKINKNKDDATTYPDKLHRIAELVADEWGITVEDLRGPGRVRQYTVPRQISYNLMREHTDASLPMIGRFFKRDHTTVIHGLKRVHTHLNALEGSRIDRVTISLQEPMFFHEHPLVFRTRRGKK